MYMNIHLNACIQLHRTHCTVIARFFPSPNNAYKLAILMWHGPEIRNKIFTNNIFYNGTTTKKAFKYNDHEGATRYIVFPVE